MFKQTDKVNKLWYGEKKIAQNLFDVSKSSDIEEEIIKQINVLKPFNMEPHKASPKKLFVLEEENNCEEEINLTSQDRIGNSDWCKCGCECKLMATFAESFCLLLTLKTRSAGGASRHLAFICNCPTISHTC